MEPEHWREIERLYHEALAREPSRRAAFIKRACGDDKALRDEVQSLLASDEQAGSFIAAPAIEVAAKALAESELPFDSPEPSPTLKPGITVSHYRILETLGAGGMGVVYRARDERLERDVAVKVLPPSTLADDSARKRFRKEALALSRLNHPNIATVHDFDTQDGIDFLVTELVPGVTLDEKLMAGALPEKDVVRIGMQMADGLEAAHREGVIHRDLKPGNLRLTPEGRLKILDFGLAKSVSPADEQTLTQSISDPAGAAGTLPYMAPEHLKDEKVDRRADLWAAGVVLYELATGRRPFYGKTSTVLADEILHAAAPSPQSWQPTVSPRLAEIISKCLEKDAENRYQSAKELLVDLRRLGTPAATATAVIPATRRAVPTRTLSIAAVVVVTIIVAAATYSYLGRKRAAAVPKITSLAVLPLANLSGDANQDYFADGMTDELTTELARIGALRVISRTSVMQYKNTRKSLPEIARELNVDEVVEGSVLRAGDRVRISAQLIQAPSDRHLWADSYDRDLRDVLTLQSEVARAIAQQIQAKLTPQDQARLARARPVDPEVHDLYLQGMFRARIRSEKELRTAIDLFQQALVKDPQFALAYVGIAEAYTVLATRYRPPREVMPLAKAAALKALQLDDNLAEAHSTLAEILQHYDWDWFGAERELRRAIELNPNLARAHLIYSRYWMTLGHVDESLRELARSQDLDPAAPDKGGWLLVMARRYDEAIQQSRMRIEQNPSAFWTHAMVGLAYGQQGLFDLAIAEGEKATKLDDSPMIAAFLAHTYAIAGKQDKAQRELAVIKDAIKRRYSCAYEVGVVYVALRRSDEAFRWFEAAYDARSNCMVWMKVDPRLDSIRSDPRYKDLLRRVGFPQ